MRVADRQAGHKMEAILGGLGSLAAVGLWAVPLRQVFWGKHSIYATRSSEGLATGFNLFAAVFNCLLWAVYVGLGSGDIMWESLLVNLFGLVVNLANSACYWRFARHKQRSEANQQLLGLLLALGGSGWLLHLAGFEGVGGVGALAAGFNVLMYFGPLMGARKAIAQRSNQSYPLVPLVMTLLCSGLWLWYALLKRDWPMLVANGLGVWFGLLQIAVWWWVTRYHHSHLLPH